MAIFSPAWAAACFIACGAVVGVVGYDTVTLALSPFEKKVLNGTLTDGSEDILTVDLTFQQPSPNGFELVVAGMPYQGVLSMSIAPPNDAPINILEFPTIVDNQGLPVVSTSHVPWCYGGTMAQVNISLPGIVNGYFEISFLLDPRMNAPTCVAWDNRAHEGSHQHFVTENGRPLVVQGMLPAMAIESIDKTIEWTIESNITGATFEIVASRAGLVFSPRFVPDGDNAVAIPSTETCMTQCAPGKFYQSSPGEIECTTFVTNIESFAISNLSLMIVVVAPPADDGTEVYQGVMVNATYQVLNASDVCFSTASFVEVNDPFSRNVYYFVSYGIPLILIGGLLGVIIYRQERMEPTAEEKEFLEAYRSRRKGGDGDMADGGDGTSDGGAINNAGGTVTFDGSMVMGAGSGIRGDNAAAFSKGNSRELHEVAL